MTATEHDVVIVGAGFAGLYSLVRMRELGLSAVVLEAGPSVGGTWFWNRYPGARCDVQSIDYSFSFSRELQQEWTWSERYATQPEILSYLRHVAERFDLEDDIELNTRVTAAHFDEDRDRWNLTAGEGEAFSARFVIMGTGCLSVIKPPGIPGLDTFEGTWLHSADWPEHPVDLTGQRIGLIGTGSTGIQLTPRLAEQAAELFVFQRTPNFSLPAQNHPVSEELARELKAGYDERRAMARKTPRGYPAPDFLRSTSALEATEEEREQVYAQSWAHGGPTFTSVFGDLLTDEEANRTAADFVRRQIREKVDDPETARALSPVDHPLGTRRPCVDIGYYESFNLEHVHLVDLSEGAILEVTPHGMCTTVGDFELDTIVFATGFDGMTGALLAMDIRGEGGRTLSEAWADGPATYLGVSVAGFPNLFTVTGPGSPSVLANMVVSIEQHVEWISDLIADATSNGHTRVSAEPEAQDQWVEEVARRAHATLVPLARSWWSGANVPGKPQVFMPFMGGIAAYGEIIDRIASEGYTGFSLESGSESEPEPEPEPVRVRVRSSGRSE